jgi:hypothetical protein
VAAAVMRPSKPEAEDVRMNSPATKAAVGAIEFLLCIVKGEVMAGEKIS